MVLNSMTYPNETVDNDHDENGSKNLDVSDDKVQTRVQYNRLAADNEDPANSLNDHANVIMRKVEVDNEPSQTVWDDTE
jgi:hypothetical protein